MLFGVTDCYSPDNDWIKPRLTKVLLSMGIEWSWNGDGMELGKLELTEVINKNIDIINIYIY